MFVSTKYPNQTMRKQLNRYADDRLTPIYDRPCAELLRQDTIKSEETSIFPLRQDEQHNVAIFLSNETTKKNGLGPYRYLTQVLTETPKRVKQENRFNICLLLPCK